MHAASRGWRLTRVGADHLVSSGSRAAFRYRAPFCDTGHSGGNAHLGKCSMAPLWSINGSHFASPCPPRVRYRFKKPPPSGFKERPTLRGPNSPPSCASATRSI